MGKHLDDFRGGEMTVATDEDMGLGPMAPQRGQEPDQEHRILGARGTLPGRRQAVTKACEVPSKMKSGR